jgi:hypothetical protein
MLSFFASIFSSVGANIFLKVFSGISKPILDYYKDKDTAETIRQGTWAKALVTAAQADVENRKTAQAERASSPIIMMMYVALVVMPLMYYTLFWADTIFQFEWDLPRAPQRLEEFGQYILITFLGGGSAVFGIVKGAKVLANAGIFRK